MTGPELSDEQATKPSGRVEIRVDAHPGQLSVIRAVAGDLAMRQDFDLDSISDLRMAVDEACTTLIHLAAVGAVLRCQFQTLPGEIRVIAEVLSADGVGPRQDTFGWRVLSALSDAVSASVEPAAAEPGGHVVRIELVKKRVVDG